MDPLLGLVAWFYFDLDEKPLLGVVVDGRILNGRYIYFVLDDTDYVHILCWDNIARIVGAKMEDVKRFRTKHGKIVRFPKKRQDF